MPAPPATPLPLTLFEDLAQLLLQHTSTSSRTQALHTLQTLFTKDETKEIVIAFIPHLLWIWIAPLRTNNTDHPESRNTQKEQGRQRASNGEKAQDEGNADASGGAQDQLQNQEEDEEDEEEDEEYLLEGIFDEIYMHQIQAQEADAQPTHFAGLDISSIYYRPAQLESRHRVAIITPKEPAKPVQAPIIQTPGNKRPIIETALRCYEDHIALCGIDSLLTYCVFMDWLLSTGKTGAVQLVSKQYPLLTSTFSLPAHLSEFYNYLANLANDPSPETAYSFRRDRSASSLTSTSERSNKTPLSPPISTTPRTVLNNVMLRSILSSLYYCAYYSPAPDDLDSFEELQIIDKSTTASVPIPLASSVQTPSFASSSPSQIRTDKLPSSASIRDSNPLSPVSIAFKSAISDVQGLIAKIKGEKSHIEIDEEKRYRGASKSNPRKPSQIQSVANRSLQRLQDRADTHGDMDTAIACQIHLSR